MSVLAWNTPVTISGFNASGAIPVIDINGNATAVWVEQSTYNVGTSSQSTNTITGTGTTFIADMTGGTIIYANGISANIIAFNSATSLTTSQSLTIANQSYNIYYNGVIMANTLPYGGSWSTPTQLSTIGTPATNAMSPKIAIDASATVSVCWLESTTSDHNSYNVNYSSYNGISWSTAISLSVSTGATIPVMAVDNNIDVGSNGNIIVAWIQSGQVSVRIKPITTGIWSSPTTFMTTGSNNPAVSINKGVSTIVWYANITQDQIMASISTSIGSAFTTEVNIVSLTDVGHNQNYPKVAVDNYGNSLAVWYRSDLGGINNTDYINVTVMSSSLASNSTNWSVPIPLSNLGMKNPATLALRCSVDPVGNTYILWTSSTYGNTYNVECNIKQIGGRMSGLVQLVANNLTSSDISATINQSSDVLILYMMYDGTYSTIQATETDIGGTPLNTYTPNTTISAVNTNNAHPRGHISLTGTQTNAIAVWQSYDSVNNTNVIQSSFGTKALLIAPTNPVITQTTNNFGVFNEFDNNLSWDNTTDPNAVAYDIYRNNLFIDQIGISGSPPTYIDHNQTESGTGTTVIYTVSAVDINFQQSPKISFSLS